MLCLQPDTRPNTAFTEEGLCPACNYHEQSKTIDWQERYEILQDLIKTIEKRPGHVFTSENLRVIRPGLGLSPKYFDIFLGKVAGKDIKRGTALSWGLIG